MKNLLISGNWKSNMNKDEAREWINTFGLQTFSENIEVVLFVPFTLLDMFSNYIKVNDLPISLGAQDISPFPKGAYTGEVNASQIKEFADYVLIGHSERRSNFGETDEIVNKKINETSQAGLKTIICVSNLDQVKTIVSDDVVIAYEPIEAIGTGKPQDPLEVSSFVTKIKEIKNTKILYGGSVNSDNIKSFTSLKNIDGALVGSESLDSQSFKRIIENAS